MKVLHAPVEIAGQMGLSVRGLRAAGLDADSMSYNNHHFAVETDFILGLDRIGSGFERRRIIKDFFRGRALDYDVFHFHFAKTLLPGYKDLPI